MTAIQSTTLNSKPRKGVAIILLTRITLFLVGCSWVATQVCLSSVTLGASNLMGTVYIADAVFFLLNLRHVALSYKQISKDKTLFTQTSVIL